MFYRKNVWAWLTQHAEAELHRTLLDEQALPEVGQLASRQLAPSRMRLMPKREGMRTIMNQSRSSSAGQRVRSVNWILTDTYLVLKRERQRRPSLIGSGVHCFDAVDKRLAPVLRWKRARELRAAALTRARSDDAPGGGGAAAATAPAARLYVATVDVQSCFDTIVQAKLWRIVAGVLDTLEEEYMVQRFAVLKPQDKSGGVVCDYKREVDASPRCVQGAACASFATTADSLRRSGGRAQSTWTTCVTRSSGATRAGRHARSAQRAHLPQQRPDERRRLSPKDGDPAG